MRKRIKIKTGVKVTSTNPDRKKKFFEKEETIYYFEKESGDVVVFN